MQQISGLIVAELIHINDLMICRICINFTKYFELLPLKISSWNFTAVHYTKQNVIYTCQLLKSPPILHTQGQKGGWIIFERQWADRLKASQMEMMIDWFLCIILWELAAIYVCVCVIAHQPPSIFSAIFVGSIHVPDDYKNVPWLWNSADT